jgi:tetratricopeptide (TPR) repeat protein
VHQAEINSIAFSPDGKIVATASDDKTAQLWNATTGQPIGRPLRHLGPVNSVVFTPDGTILITGSDDRRIRFWQVPAALPGKVEQIKAWAELTSGMILSPEGATSELESSDLNARLAKLTGGEQKPLALANPFAAATSQGLTNHIREALGCMDAEDWQAALWQLDHEIGRQPEAWLAYVWRSKVRVQLGRLDQASADLAKAFEVGPPDPTLSWYRSFVAESVEKQHWQNVFWYLDRLIAARPQESALYLARADAYRKQKQRKEAAKAYDQALRLDPSNLRAWLEKGTFDNNHGRWQEAAKAWAKALELDPDNHWERYHSATLHLYIGDVDGYRRDCRELLQRFGQTNDPITAERTAKACLLLPPADEHEKLVQRLAQLAVSGTEKHPYYGTFQLAKGMAEYRAGHFEQSTEWLRGSHKANFSSFAQFKALAQLFLAMAQYRQGHADEARTTLAEATTLIDAEVKKWNPDDGNMGNQDWFMPIVVRKEAEALVMGKPTR